MGYVFENVLQFRNFLGMLATPGGKHGTNVLHVCLNIAAFQYLVIEISLKSFRRGTKLAVMKRFKSLHFIHRFNIFMEIDGPA